MKQRIRTVGIIRTKEGILFLKRAHGRSDDTPVWELPTGKIQFGEQPEEAMLRAIFDYTGVHAAKVTLKDVVTFVATIGSSQLNNLYIVYEVKLGFHEKIHPNDRYTAYKHIKINDLPSYHIDEASRDVLELDDKTGPQIHQNYRDTANSATVYIDGCSRGNPGPAGVGCYIVSPDGSVLDRGGDFVGFASSRIAEYYALKYGIEKAKKLGLKSVRFVSDNLMMVNQMNGVYKVKNLDLIPLYNKIKSQLKDFESYAFIHVHREQNCHADKEANDAVDRHFDQSMLR